MTVLPIYVQEKPGARRELWAYRQGTRAEIETSAQNLLEEMHKDGFPRARVWVGGTLIKKRRAAAESEEEEHK